jgi:hypothetical protein
MPAAGQVESVAAGVTAPWPSVTQEEITGAGCGLSPFMPCKIGGGEWSHHTHKWVEDRPGPGLPDKQKGKLRDQDGLQQPRRRVASEPGD